MVGKGVRVYRAAGDVGRELEAGDRTHHAIGTETEAPREGPIQIAGRCAPCRGKTVGQVRGRPRALRGGKSTSDKGEPEAGCRNAVGPQFVIDGRRGSCSKGVARRAQEDAEVTRDE